MKNTAKVKSTWFEGMRVENRAGDHTVIMDQPEGMGGTNAGANPMEYLLFALGGCLATMAAIIAKQEGIQLDAFSVELEGDYDMEYIMGRTEDRQGGFLEIREKIFIDANITDEEKQDFLEKIHNRCPVTNSLRNKTQIISELK